MNYQWNQDRVWLVLPSLGTQMLKRAAARTRSSMQHGGSKHVSSRQHSGLARCQL